MVFRGRSTGGGTVVDGRPGESGLRFHGDFSTRQNRLPTPDGKPFVVAHEHGTLSVELYAPRGADTQAPHRRDEVYVGVRGEGWFVNGPARHRFGPGDLLFVPAGVAHRFEEFTEDLAVWVVFHGLDGGEQVGQGP
jgi:mannose-6-phosphate isomerase-like protein (cupin superfamily)